VKFLWTSIFLPIRFFILGLIVALAYVLGHFVPVLIPLAKLGLWFFVSSIILDLVLLFRIREGVSATRTLPDRFSNGDQNHISFSVENHYPFSIKTQLIDEVPIQFQKRDFIINRKLKKGENWQHIYSLRPVERGNYHFGNMNVFVKTVLGIIERRYTFDLQHDISVYPSFLQLQNIELMTFAKMQNRLGLKSIRRIGNNKEFEQVRNYVVGDELKHMNWKATARKSKLMVNQFRDEREQEIYCLIDMGRSMKMPFNEMSLLDYAINSTLALSKVVLKNYDKIGLITYSNRIQTVVPSDNKNSQMQKIMESLYRQKTDFKESTMEPLFTFIKRKITHRSLLIIFTNFESVISMQRNMEVLKQLRRSHLVILISFENMELEKVISEKAHNLESVYLKATAEKFIFEKRIFMQDLQQIGIQSILSTPDGLSTNTINKYLEVKHRGIL